MGVVFLDFDGVLNSAAYYARGPSLADRVLATARARDAGAFDPDAVARLNRLTRGTRHGIVVSSSWRDTRTLADLRAVLADVGVRARVRDTTPQFFGGQRGDEIAQWLREHPRTRRYVVLDDRNDMDGVRAHFVRTRESVGLTDDDVNRARAILEAP